MTSVRLLVFNCLEADAWQTEVWVWRLASPLSTVLKADWSPNSISVAWEARRGALVEFVGKQRANTRDCLLGIARPGITPAKIATGAAEVASLGTAQVPTKTLAGDHWLGPTCRLDQHHKPRTRQ